MALTSPRSNQSNELEQTYSLFSGGRAISENLQLDRPLQAARNAGPNTPSDKPVKLDTLTGITVAEIDWKARNAGKTPLLDPLAAHIPADQHALFLPSPKAAQTVLSEFLGGITPILDLNGSSGFDPRFVQERYERQLGVSMADLARLSGSGMVKGMAVTGSDPYFVTGTDLAILFETDEPGKLVTFTARTTRSGLPRFIRRDRSDGGREGRLDVRFRENSRSGDQRIHRRARSCGRTDELAGATGAGIANGPESELSTGRRSGVPILPHALSAGCGR